MGQGRASRSAGIRHLAQRKQPLSAAQLERRYGNMIGTARRHFGSWTKAVLAAGVDPTRLQRVVPWTMERVIEAVLKRALRNESLVGRLIEPRSLVEAGQRFFGSWAAAVTASGLDSRITALPPRRAKQPLAVAVRRQRSKPSRTARKFWTKELVIAAIHARLRQQKPVNSTALVREDGGLYRAGRRHLKSWSDALRAAGLDPEVHRRGPSGRTIITDADLREQIARPSQANDGLRPDRPA